MKLASLRHGRDGRLVVVSDDLAWYAHSGPEVPTLPAALDDWARAEPRLRAVAEGVNKGTILRERFHEREAASPLPRAFQWADGSAYVNHVALVRQARGAKMPESFWTDPLMYQGGSDYVGGTTTLHALWMGVPTLSIAGLTPACRTGVSIAEHAGLHVVVANDSADFVSKGVARAKKLSELAEIRAGLRQRFDQSAMRQPVIAAGLERALRIAWRRWCEGLPAESIDVSMNDFPKEEVLL